jgi:hypothetical protein
MRMVRPTKLRKPYSVGYIQPGAGGRVSHNREENESQRRDVAVHASGVDQRVPWLARPGCA